MLVNKLVAIAKAVAAAMRFLKLEKASKSSYTLAMFPFFLLYHKNYYRKW